MVLSQSFSWVVEQVEVPLLVPPSSVRYSLSS